MNISELIKIDTKNIINVPGEILCFVAVSNEMLRIEYFLEHYRKLGIDRFFFVDNGSVDGTREFIVQQEDCHCFHTNGAYFVENISPPAWTNTLANTYGHGHWCVTVDADELLVFPHSEKLNLPKLCEFLSDNGDEALYCSMVDMYPDGPVASANYQRGKPFIDACPYFDPTPGWIWPRDGECPPEQMFGGVRERVFWKGERRHDTPPCLNKVPLVLWQKGMKYLVSMHFHSGARLASITGNLLHFKFLQGFVQTSKSQIDANLGVIEKSLQERATYLSELEQSPDLTFKNDESVYYEGTGQLVQLGWMNSSSQYEKFADIS